VQHQSIYNAVRSRDVETAVATVNEHLRQARQDLIGSDGLTLGARR